VSTFDTDVIRLPPAFWLDPAVLSLVGARRH